MQAGFVCYENSGQAGAMFVINQFQACFKTIRAVCRAGLSALVVAAGGAYKPQHKLFFTQNRGQKTFVLFQMFFRLSAGTAFYLHDNGGFDVLAGFFKQLFRRLFICA